MADLVTGNPQRCMAYLAQADPERRYAVREVKPKRSLTANAYYWAMLNKLARALGMPDSEVHERMLDEYGVCDVFTIDGCVPLSAYFDHYRIISEYVDGETGRRKRIVKALVGSSKMDSAEFSRLVNGMREECEGQGIDVLTPAEIAALRFVEPDND